MYHDHTQKLYIVKSFKTKKNNFISKTMFKTNHSIVCSINDWSNFHV